MKNLVYDFEEELRNKRRIFCSIPSFEYSLQELIFKKTAGNARAILRVNFSGYVESHQTIEGTF